MAAVSSHLDTVSSHLDTEGGAASFDRLAIHYDRYSFLAGRKLFSYLTARLPDRGSRAVDLGCGTGRHATLLSRHFDHVLAVDICTSMLALAQRHRAAPNITYQPRDLLDVTADRDGRFDLVFSAFTLHHVADLEPALRQIRCLVRPGGQAVLVDLCDQARDRAWLLAEARRTLVRDIVRHHRPVREARELYRLSVEPNWLDHQVSDRPLPPGRFEPVYRAVFPGAEFTPMYRSRAMHWRKQGPAS